ncbi:hypothetical protein ABZ514_17165 [Streptomyces pristinaespiralis]
MTTPATLRVVAPRGAPRRRRRRTDGLFRGALLGGFAGAFVITAPVNKWLIGRGKGHAVVHAYH